MCVVSEHVSEDVVMKQAILLKVRDWLAEDDPEETIFQAKAGNLSDGGRFSPSFGRNGAQHPFKHFFLNFSF